MSRHTKPALPITLTALLLCAALAGCAKPVTQCEGGVEDLSTMSSVVVDNPC
ncbi:hypothetical protein [Rhodobacter maris]|uniref:Lipoprotein n=1 Tax=Rhodobacter maris TaxID=446682 RepID=A0A285RFN5_9RHOB|nr:hypothetical protein [Rhodobacter maris]SOB92916.1 hypothetical protein SAMN05877831_10178 [Rhodobacter maris]